MGLSLEATEMLLAEERAKPKGRRDLTLMRELRQHRLRLMRPRDTVRFKNL